MMVDYIKLIVRNLSPTLWENNDLLDFSLLKNITENGALIPKRDRNNKVVKRKGKTVYLTPYKDAFYNGLVFTIYETGLVTIAGSLHIYYNKGAHNYNDFSYNAFLGVVEDLIIKFKLDPKDCLLRCVEIGINILPPLPSNKILDFSFLHKTKPFEWGKNSEEGKYLQVVHSQYIIKLYNKALHYINKGFDIDAEILRFEIKYTKMQKLNNIGIYTLQDLINYDLYNFKDTLLTEWNNVLFFDNTIQSKSVRLMNYKNPIYWRELIDKKTKTNFYKHKDILKVLTANYSDNIQAKITRIMSDKIDYLNGRGARIDPLTIRSVHTPFINTDVKLCQVTGLNISMQKETSILLSHSGLKYYYQTNKKVFEQVKRKYLPKIWHKVKFNIQIKELAHNIRNTSSNRNIKQRKIYPEGQFNLLAIFKLN